MGCSELKPELNKSCNEINAILTESVFMTKPSNSVFNKDGFYIGKGDFNNGVLNITISDNHMQMTVKEYCNILGKSTSWATKHLRNGMSLPYVIKSTKNEIYKNWELTVSPSIKLKQPLK